MCPHRDIGYIPVKSKFKEDIVIELVMIESSSKERLRGLGIQELRTADLYLPHVSEEVAQTAAAY